MSNKKTTEIIIVKPRHWKAFLNKRMTDKQFRKKFKALKGVKNDKPNRRVKKTNQTIPKRARVLGTGSGGVGT